MCLAIPARIEQPAAADQPLALVDILGVRRRISVELLADDPPRAGDWVLVHVGFALSRVSAEQAQEQLALLTRMGSADEARQEVQRVDP